MNFLSFWLIIAPKTSQNGDFFVVLAGYSALYMLENFKKSQSRFWLRAGGGVGHEFSLIDTNILIFTKKKVKVKVNVNVDFGFA